MNQYVEDSPHHIPVGPMGSGKTVALLSSDMISSDVKSKALRAFERRFGKSMLPLKIRKVSEFLVRVFDPETGSWAEYDTQGPRIRRTSEYDHAGESN